MLQNDSDSWLKYTGHILREEGKTSKNPSDTASRCVPSGKIHTNKGVTYCTFKDRATSLGISPLTYERFLNLTDEDVAKFIYSYYKDVSGSSLPDSIALAMTEANWLSGPSKSWEHLYKSLSSFGVVTSSQKDAISKVDKISEQLLFDEFIKVRKQYLQSLLNSPKYAMNTGWIPRLKRFYDNFSPSVIGAKKKIGDSITLSDIINSIFTNN